MLIYPFQNKGAEQNEGDYEPTNLLSTGMLIYLSLLNSLLICLFIQSGKTNKCNMIHNWLFFKINLFHFFFLIFFYWMQNSSIKWRSWCLNPPTPFSCWIALFIGHFLFLLLLSSHLNSPYVRIILFKGKSYNLKLV